MCELIEKYGEGERVLRLLQTVVQECVSDGFVAYNERLCGKVAKMYQSKGLWSKAYSFFLRSNDLDSTIACLKEVMKRGYQGEEDLFVVRLCFEVLIRNRKDGSGIRQVAAIREAFKMDDARDAPLYNFVRLLVEALQANDHGLLLKFINVYSPQLHRYSAFIEYLDRISRYYLGKPVKKPNMMQQMLSNMMQGGNPMANQLGGQ